jgi:hypothetical protein
MGLTRYARVNVTAAFEGCLRDLRLFAGADQVVMKAPLVGS